MTVDVILIDTVDLAGTNVVHFTVVVVKFRCSTRTPWCLICACCLTCSVLLLSWLTGAAGGASPEEDAHYFDALPHRPKQAAADQWAWIEAQLAASKAQYVLVGGHYSL